MKKNIVLLVILVLGFGAGNVWANGLLSPSFEEGNLCVFETLPIPGWAVYGTNGEHQGNPAAVKTGTKSIKEWLDDTGMYQDVPVVVGNTYNFSAWAISLSSDGGGLYGRDGIFKIEWRDASGELIFDEQIGYFYGAVNPGEPVDPYDTWKYLSGSSVAPDDAVICRVFFGMTAGTLGPDAHVGSVCWDDVSVTTPYTASDPVPTNGSIDLLPFQITSLTWTKPAPRNSGDTILCDVWFGTDPNMPGTNTKIVDKQNVSTVAIGSILPHKDYYWRVDCYDPAGAGPEIKTEGWRWKFSTSDNCAGVYMSGDVNKDCYVNFTDFAKMSEDWLKCNDLANSNCE